MSDNNTSTLQSYVDSATGYVQSTIGSLTGNNTDQVRVPLLGSCFRVAVVMPP